MSGSNLFVANLGSGTIGEYSLSNGTYNPSLISGLNGPYGIAVSGSNLFVVSYSDGTIGEYTTSGAVVNPTPLIGLEPFGPTGIAVSGSTLLVADDATGTVAEYDTSGNLINDSLISGLVTPTGIAIESTVPIPGAILLFAPGIAGVLAMRRRFSR